MTASSVTSVSNDPPSLLVCVNKSARMDFILSDSDYFCVNILSSGHQDVSEICATPTKGDERFSVGAWSAHRMHGVHHLEDAPAVFLCKKERAIAHGTHTIYIANLVEALVHPEKQQHLVYADGQYHHI